MTLAMFLLLAAIVCFILAALSVSLGRVSPGWLGMVFIVLVQYGPALG